MAKKFVDGDAQSERATTTLQDGTALTLTNKVRILWDDTYPNLELKVAIDKLRDAIIQQTG